MEANKLNFITKELVEKAAQKIDAESIPKDRQSVAYFVTVRDKEYPFKYLVDIAAQIAGHQLENFKNGENYRKVFQERTTYKAISKEGEYFLREEVEAFIKSKGKLRIDVQDSDLNLIKSLHKKLVTLGNILKKSLGAIKLKNASNVINASRNTSIKNYMWYRIFPNEAWEKRQLALTFTIDDRFAFRFDSDNWKEGSEERNSLLEFRTSKQLEEYISIDEFLAFENYAALSERILAFYNNRILPLSTEILGLKQGIEQHEKESQEPSFTQKKTNSSFPLNQILFGPPGTGKTYSTIDKVVELLVPDQYQRENHEINKEVYDTLIESGQVAFTTFHQSMSYEDFVEGIKPLRDENNQVYYEIEDGIFKDMADRARSSIYLKAKTGTAAISIDADLLHQAEFYKVSLGDSVKGEDAAIYDYCIKNNCIAIGWGNDIDFTAAKDVNDIKTLINSGNEQEAKSSFAITAIKCLKIWMKKGDLVFVANGNKKCKAIGVIDGDYYYDNDNEIGFNQFRRIKWLHTNIDIKVSNFYYKNFSMQAIYKMYKNEIKLDFFKSSLQKTRSTDKYVLIIDEINRGNVSQIFGELITLIEKDKRLGQSEALKVTLPYSKESFSVPDNLYIIGTMNTADRSVEALDTALRRRFAFIEKAPDATLLNDIELENIDFPLLLETINNRIEKLLNKDYMIGHAYFLSLEKASNKKATLKDIFADKILPLLQEYFYGNFGKIQLVLGKQFVEKKQDNTVVFAESDFTGEDYQDRDIYHILNIAETDIVEAVKSIYATQ